MIVRVKSLATVACLQLPVWIVGSQLHALETILPVLTIYLDLQCVHAGCHFSISANQGRSRHMVADGRLQGSTCSISDNMHMASGDRASPLPINFRNESRPSPLLL